MVDIFTIFYLIRNRTKNFKHIFSSAPTQSLSTGSQETWRRQRIENIATYWLKYSRRLAYSRYIKLYSRFNEYEYDEKCHKFAYKSGLYIRILDTQIHTQRVQASSIKHFVLYSQFFDGRFLNRFNQSTKTSLNCFIFCEFGFWLTVLVHIDDAEGFTLYCSTHFTAVRVFRFVYNRVRW